MTKTMQVGKKKLNVEQIRPVRDNHLVKNTLRTRLLMIEGLGKLFWSKHGYLNEHDFRKAKGDGKLAVILFLENYAFQRLSGFPKYSEAAIKAFKEVTQRSSTPPQGISKNVWNRFLTILNLPRNGKGANKKVNPLYSYSKGYKKPLLEWITGLKADNYNITVWAERMLRQGKAEEAYAQIETIRGVSQKIGTFFLRDVAYVFRIPEMQVGDAMYLQPIDTWVRKAANILLSKYPKFLKGDDWKLAEGLSFLAKKYGVNGCLLNTGLYLLGTEILETEDFNEALKSSKSLCKCYLEYADDLEFWSKRVRELSELGNTRVMRGK